MVLINRRWLKLDQGDSLHYGDIHGGRMLAKDPLVIHQVLLIGFYCNSRLRKV